MIEIPARAGSLTSQGTARWINPENRSKPMLEQTYESSIESQTRKPSVWRDSALGLAASLGVGFLTGAALTLVVFAIVVITLGQ